MDKTLEEIMEPDYKRLCPCIQESIQKKATLIREYFCQEINKIENPYPESIFVEPTKKQYALLHKKLQEVGLTIDKFSGAVGRGLFRYIISQAKERISP